MQVTVKCAGLDETAVPHLTVTYVVVDIYQMSY